MSLEVKKPAGRSVYYIVGTVNGRRVRKSTRTSNKKIAEQQKSKYEKELHTRAIFGPEATATFTEAALGFINAGGEARFVEKVYPYFKGMKLMEITQADIDDFGRAAYPDAAPATLLRQWYAPVSAVFNHGAETGLCQPRKIKKPKPGEARTDWRFPAEIQSVFAHLPKYWQAVAWTAVGTGARSGELSSLKTNRVWLESGEAFLEAADTKAGRSRMLELPPPTIAALSTIDRKKDYLFPAEDGKQWPEWENSGGPFNKEFNAALKDACEAAGAPTITAHVLRHTWATWYYAVTQDLIRLQKLGGWASLKLVERYTHIAPRKLKDEVLAAGFCFGAELAHSDTDTPQEEAK